jgi:hypothetical protein
MRTDLLSQDLGRRTLNFFALGGSGVRTLEPLLHLCAMGLGPHRLRVIVIDPDQSNAAVIRARQLLDQYRATRAALGSGGSLSGYFRTEVVDAVADKLLWSPIADDQHLPDTRFRARVDRALMDGDRTRVLGDLFDLLYGKRVQDMDLGLGFRGVPSIGTVFMNRLRSERFFEQLLKNGQDEGDSVFFAVGSVFGGTGASALPVVGKTLCAGIRKADGSADLKGIPRHRLGAALLLPYFTLPTPESSTAPDGGIRPEDALFLQNAAAAIPTYVQEEGGYGGYYVIGDSQPRPQEVNAVGGEKQENRPHFVELYAALAALDFAARGGEAEHRKKPSFRVAAVRDTNPRWTDLPLETGSIRRIVGALVAAHTYLTFFRPDGGSHPDIARHLRGVTWLDLIGLSARDLGKHAAALDHLGAYYGRLWTWIQELRLGAPAIQLTNWTDRPRNVQLNLTIAGWRPKEGRRRMRDVFEVFRHWNDAAADRVTSGLPGLVDVMRRGSEGFADEWFTQVVSEEESA